MQSNTSGSWKARTHEQILASIEKLMRLHSAGDLGGERMPEDANPCLNLGSKENYHYFTLPMALNYQRNSYKMWEGALATYLDDETRFVFDPQGSIDASEENLRVALCKHKLALQPLRHVRIWRTICTTLRESYGGDVRNLFVAKGFDVVSILETIQVTQKKGFPYLSGPKIANYWLYVMSQYTNAKLKNRHALSVAPDTHVMQASVRLGLVAASADESNLRSHVADAWKKVLVGSSYSSIDIHTPLWLWSRKNFIPAV